MRIQDILVESQQLDEGPLANKIGTAIGKGVGTLAKGVGAVAGGVAGLGSAVKKGFAAGKQTVAGAGDDEDPAAAPAAGGAAAPSAPGRLATAFKAGNQYAKGAMAAGQKPSMAAAADAGVDSAPAAPARKAAPAAGGSAPAATPAAGGAAPAGAPTAPGAAPSGTMYAQVKANIDKLDKKGKQRILQALQKEVGAAPAAKPAAGAPAAPGAAPAAQPNTMANAPVSKTNTAKPGNPNATAAAKPAAGANPGAAAFGQMAKDLTQKPEPQQQKVPPKKVVAKPAAAPAAEPAAEPAAAPSGEKTIANPVATVGTKRASNIGQQTFDTQTGKALPGQSINAIRKKAEYGTGALGAARKRIKAGAAAPAESKTNTRPALAEGFSLFRKK